jgi:undecaprenyl-diphosphatase
MNIILDKLHYFDTATFRWCISRRYSDHLAIIGRWFSHVGDGLYYLLLGLAILWLDSVSGTQFFYVGLLAFAMERPLYFVLKNTVKRARPQDALNELVARLVPSDKFSFPSGHTAAGFVMATLVASFYPEFTVLAYTLATLIGFSRVLLGVHFPGDILAGALLGMTSANIALAVVF